MERADVWAKPNEEGPEAVAETPGSRSAEGTHFRQRVTIRHRLRG